MPGTNLFSPISSTLQACLTDQSGLMVYGSCTGAPPSTAGLFAHGALINRTDSGTGTAALYQNTGSSDSPVWTLLDTALPGDTASSLVDTNSLTVVDVATVASQVNHLRVTPSATGSVSANVVTLSPSGTDTDVSIGLSPQAAGRVYIGSSTGTGQIIVGTSSGAQSVLVGNGTGVQTVSIANTTTAGATVNVATGAGTNAVNIGSSAGTSSAFIQGGLGPTAVTVAAASTGVITVGGTAQTGDVVVGSSSGAQAVKIGNGAGAPTVTLAGTSTAGATVSVAGAATGAGNTDTVTIAGGNAAATGTKVVNVLTGTPGTPGSNRMFIGNDTNTGLTIKAAVSQAEDTNLVVTETGVNNAIVATLNDASGTPLAVGPGMRVRILLAHTLQAGANTLNLNAAGAAAIKSHYNPATDIATAYAVGGIVELLFDGTVWQDMSQ